MFINRITRNLRFHCMEDIENSVEETVTRISEHEEILQEHTIHNNIQICGFPETVENKDLVTAATTMFNQFLG